MAALLKFYGAARHKFQKQHAHKNTSVFIGDNIIERFSEEKQNIRHRRRQENQVWIMGGGGGDQIIPLGPLEILMAPF